MTRDHLRLALRHLDQFMPADIRPEDLAAAAKLVEHAQHIIAIAMSRAVEPPPKRRRSSRP